MQHTRILEPADGVLAFYDGRIEGYRYALGPNWVDDGALSLGIASYAILDGSSALVYDTHVSIEHGRFIRQALEDRGVSELTVVLSHWHLDHVAGTAVFDDCEVIASERTAELLSGHRAAIEAGTHEGPPPVDPLVLPTRTFSESDRIVVGGIEVDLVQVNIHSADATVLWLPEQRLLLCGDTMEDTITYVAEPDGFDTHLADLERLERLGPERILPNHGDPSVIGRGGYSRGLIRATQQYIRALMRVKEDAAPASTPLRELVAGPLAAGWINYYEPYESVHAENLRSAGPV
jgi:glyoxylase-like metal-dependent hydrolase (beta-lactamase superfamily II)